MVWRSLVCAALCAWIAGCGSGIKTQIAYDHKADFSSYQTWDFLPGEPKPTGYRGLDDPAVNERVQGAIENGLSLRHMKRSSDNPDFYVAYHLAFDEQISSRNIENYYQYLNYTVFVPSVTSSYTQVYDLGTLIIDVLDTRTHTHVWRGAAQTKVNTQAGPRENEPKLRDAARKILADFPPKN